MEPLKHLTRIPYGSMCSWEDRCGNVCDEWMKKRLEVRRLVVIGRTSWNFQFASRCRNQLLENKNLDYLKKNLKT